MAMALSVSGALPAAAQTSETVTLRGRPQTLRLSGPPAGDPVIVSSGDGGWVHLAPHVASLLADRGFFVVGVDARAYLASFTSATETLRPEDEPHDYARLAERASRATGKKPILVGVSEGAGLSLLAAGDPETKQKIAGVVAFGLPDLNELGWRLRDSMIYLTHGVPREPTFSSGAIVGQISPLPFAQVHSTHDEFVPLARAQQIFDAAREPKRLWIVNASNHRFSDKPDELARVLGEAMRWVADHKPQ